MLSLSGLKFCENQNYAAKSIELLKLAFRSFQNCLNTCTVESRLYVQVGTQKFGRRTERDAQVKIIFRITQCKVFWMRLYQLDEKTSGNHN